MTIELKLRILAVFFTKTRVDNSPYLEKLFELDDYWHEVYEGNRIRLNFQAAQILANECVIAKVLSDNYE